MFPFSTTRERYFFFQILNHFFIFTFFRYTALEIQHTINADKIQSQMSGQKLKIYLIMWNLFVQVNQIFFFLKKNWLKKNNLLGGNFTTVLTTDCKVYGWGKTMLTNDPVKEPIELKVSRVDEISRVFCWGSFIFMEDKKTLDWFASPPFFKSDVKEFRALNKLNSVSFKKNILF